MLKDRHRTIIYLGFNYFPFGFAPGERQRLISKSLIQQGYRVIVVARKGSLKKESIHLPYKGKIEGIDYMYTSGTAYRPKSFIKRNLLKIYGTIGEFFLMLSLQSTFGIDFAILYSRNLTLLRYYHFMSRIIGFKIVTDYTERASAWAGVNGNYSTFEQKSPLYTNASFCISNFLEQSVREINPHLPILKVPVICDVEKIKNLPAHPDSKPYFLFCGTLFYQEIIEFIVESFLQCNNKKTYLYFVVNGGDKQKDIFKTYIDQCPKKDMIRIFTDVEYNVLIGLYKSAIALLIPLRSTTQDIARFPHKIGEYTASGRPVITTKVGEIPLFFKDMENALIADEFTPQAFKEKMDFVIENRAKADIIGLNGLKVAELYFDYKAIGSKIAPFMENL